VLSTIWAGGASVLLGFACQRFARAAGVPAFCWAPRFAGRRCAGGASVLLGGASVLLELGGASVLLEFCWSFAGVLLKRSCWSVRLLERFAGFCWSLPESTTDVPAATLMEVVAGGSDAATAAGATAAGTAAGVGGGSDGRDGGGRRRRAVVALGKTEIEPGRVCVSVVGRWRTGLFSRCPVRVLVTQWRPVPVRPGH